MAKFQKPKARVPDKQGGPAGKVHAAKGRPASALRRDTDSGSPTEDSFKNQADLLRSSGKGRASSEGEDKEEDVLGAAISGSEDDASSEGTLEEGEDESEDDEEGDSDVEEEDLDLLPDEFREEGNDSDDAGDIDIGGGSDSDLMADDDDDDDDDGEEEEEDADADNEDDGDEDGERQEARRRSGSLAGAAPSTGGDGGGFLEGSKGASFARAFSKLLKAKSKPSEVGRVPILEKSKTVAKRQAEEDADAEARRDAKRARQELRQRGHVKVPRKGEDPGHDQLEKQLGRLATKGVVMLFNAISTSQKQAGGAGTGPGAAKKPAKLSKASFLAQLRATGNGGDAVAGGGSGGGGVLSAAAAAAKAGSGEAAAAPGWKVLQAGFSGLLGGGKMKDWDRKPTGSDEEDAQDMGVGGAAGGTSSESDDGEGW
ncbi:hypothetical protein Vafri_12918 [Volvox africanus]|uniref:Rrp15p-domain-containing protein n=1 Tax=Volvox africanus TaxID=51714 RepID=A0A8J4BAX1_9CHLO|nr:hypothetical protein Vafri_12918 [Volvox africanus]